MTTAIGSIPDRVFEIHERLFPGDVRRKFEVSDLDPELIALAYEYMDTYEGESEFVNDIRAKVGDGDLYDNQIRGLLNTAMADARREKGMIGFARTVNGFPSEGTYRVPLDGEEYELRVKEWATKGDGTLVVSIRTDADPKNPWLGVAAIDPEGQFSVWRDYRDDIIETVVRSFLEADAPTQQGWALALPVKVSRPQPGSAKPKAKAKGNNPPF